MSAGESSVPKSGGKSPSNLRSALGGDINQIKTIAQ
jgi:hypothetical protein